MVQGLTPEEHRALRLVAGRRHRAWIATDRLARRGIAAGTLAALEAAGWLAHWSHDRTGKALRRDYWTLTPIAAFRLEVELDVRLEPRGEDAVVEVPYWIERGGDLAPNRVPSVKCEFRLEFPDRLPDPKHSAEEYLADLETGETTTDPAAAARLLGAPVRRDPRPARRPAPKRRRRPPGKADDGSRTRPDRPAA